MINFNLRYQKMASKLLILNLPRYEGLMEKNQSQDFF